MGAAQAHAWTSTCFEVNVRIWLLYWWIIIIIKGEKKGGGYFQQVWSQLQLAKSFSVYHSLYINLQRFDMLKPRSYGNSNRPNSTGQLFCYYKTTFLGRDSHKSKFNSLNSNIRDVNSKFQLNSVSQEAPPPFQWWTQVSIRNALLERYSLSSVHSMPHIVHYGG